MQIGRERWRNNTESECRRWRERERERDCGGEELLLRQMVSLV